MRESRRLCVRSGTQFPPGGRVTGKGAEARRLCLASARASRPGVLDFRYRTRDGWCRKRRVVGKAEHAGRCQSSLCRHLNKHARMAPIPCLYEDLRPWRGPRTTLASSSNCSPIVPSATMMANQLRMWFGDGHHVLNWSRHSILHFTQFADASAQTIRLKL